MHALNIDNDMKKN